MSSFFDLKKYQQDLDRMVNLEEDLRSLQKENYILKNFENQFLNLEKKVCELNEEKLELESKIRKMASAHYNEINELQIKKDLECLNLKNQINQINQKYETYLRYEAYLDSMEKLNKELTQKLDGIEESIRKDMQLERDNYTIKIQKYKHKTLDLIRNMKKHSSQKAIENSQNAMKIMSFQNNHLFDELNEQSMMIEELLQKLTEKDNIIRAMKLEINIHKEVDRLFTHQKLIMKKVIKDITKNGHGQASVLTNDLVFNTLPDKEKPYSKSTISTKKTNLQETKTLKLEQPISSSRIRNSSTIDNLNDNAGFQTVESIRNLKSSSEFSKRVVKSSNGFYKEKDIEKNTINTNNNGIMSRHIREKMIEEKEENLFYQKNKFLKNYKWYFNIIETLLKELKDNNLKLNWIIEFEKTDPIKISIITKFLNLLHSEIKNKFFEQKVTLKAQSINLLSKADTRQIKFRSKSILDHLFSSKKV